ncbi:MAG: hypothetical protein NTV34_02515 [Proteobacteria bacterium]|nr:hypothetical protein [Pseudomonadota bacterium]
MSNCKAQQKDGSNLEGANTILETIRTPSLQKFPKDDESLYVFLGKIEVGKTQNEAREISDLHCVLSHFGDTCNMKDLSRKVGNYLNPIQGKDAGRFYELLLKSSAPNGLLVKKAMGGKTLLMVKKLKCGPQAGQYSCTIQQQENKDDNE